MSSGTTPYPVGTRIVVLVAYETSKGNPFKAYKPYDFDLKSDLISIVALGCEINERSGNQIAIEVKDQDFSLQVSGFDVNRDIVVRAKIEPEAAVTEALPNTAIG